MSSKNDENYWNKNLGFHNDFRHGVGVRDTEEFYQALKKRLIDEIIIFTGDLIDTHSSRNF
jgi:hypothetical protein